MFRLRTKEKKRKDKRMDIIRTTVRICYYYPIEKDNKDFSIALTFKNIFFCVPMPFYYSI